MRILRLGPDDAPRIVQCTRRVYGSTYANEDFYDATRLSLRMREGSLFSVGAVRPDGRLLGHMAMSRRPGATAAELGNSMIDPEARGQGLIWKIGSELVSWSLELGDVGFLDYPTTAHHIMQRKSIENGWETGLMLGYIPESTDGKVAAHETLRRDAATIVYHPYPGRGAERRDQYLPSYGSDRIVEFARSTGLLRAWHRPEPPDSSARTSLGTHRFDARDLLRTTVGRSGGDVRRHIEALEAQSAACRQIDFAMSDPGIDAGVSAAIDAGYWFCGWLPGFGAADVFRVQKVDRARTNLSPLLVNPVARSLLGLVPAI